MDITQKSLEEKAEALKQEIITFSRTAQAEINQLQAMLQKKVRDSQTKVDNLEGKYAALQELIAQVKGEKPEGADRAPATPENEKTD